MSVTVPYETLQQVSFYALDGDSAGRTMSVSVADVVTGNVLDSVSVSSFSGGKWLRWTISGPVAFTFTNTGPYDAVLSGLFIDPPVSGSALYPTYLSETFVQGVSGDRLLRSRSVDQSNTALDRGAVLDGLGSVQGALTPGGGGGASTLSALSERDAFGNALAGSGGSGASGDNPFQFLGGLGYWQEPQEANDILLTPNHARHQSVRPSMEPGRHQPLKLLLISPGSSLATPIIGG